MNNIKAIYMKEIKSFFNSPMAYIFLTVFVLFNGYFFTNTFFLINQSDLRSLFDIIRWVYIIFIPAITMGLIAREKGLGTMEVLSTLPIRDSEFVFGKYLAAWTLIGVGLIFTLFHFITLIYVGTNIDYGAIICGYVGLFLVGGVYASIGIFTSSLTENQVIALILGATIVFILFLADKMLFFAPAYIAGILQYIGVDYHLSNMTRGVIDSRDIIYFGSLIWLFLTLTVHSIGKRRWR
jgi:ABC-2 type transport system permease protein